METPFTRTRAAPMFPTTQATQPWVCRWSASSVRSTIAHVRIAHRSRSTPLLSTGVGEAGTEELKAEVLRLVSEQRRRGTGLEGYKRRLLSAVEALEAEGGGVTAPLEGRWALVYSTQQSENEERSALDSEVAQVAINRLYKLFFRFAPALAGSQETGGSRGVANEQLIDLQSGRVDNVVQVSLPSWVMGGKVQVRVWGEVEAATDGSSDLTVTFTGWSLRGAGERAELKLPLPRPRGSLATTFCDASMRISRGGRGGLFITTRLPST